MQQWKKGETLPFKMLTYRSIELTTWYCVPTFYEWRQTHEIPWFRYSGNLSRFTSWLHHVYTKQAIVPLGTTHHVTKLYNKCSTTLYTSGHSTLVYSSEALCCKHHVSYIVIYPDKGIRGQRLAVNQDTISSVYSYSAWINTPSVET